MILGSLQLLAESFTTAEKCGIGSQNVHELVKGLVLVTAHAFSSSSELLFPKEILPAPGYVTTDIFTPVIQDEPDSLTNRLLA